MATNEGPAPLTALRVDREPAVVLHTWPYRETSLIVDLFTRHHGRIAAIARGARRPRSEMRGLLQSFTPLSAAWSGKSEVRTLRRLEWVGGVPPLRGKGLMSGFYLNELLMRILPREDAHQELFDQYLQVLLALTGGHDASMVLRGFERHLLVESGYGHRFDCDHQGDTIDDACWYRVEARQAPVPVGIGAYEGEVGDAVFSGRVLRAFSLGQFDEVEESRECKRLTRVLIASVLEGAPLKTRAVMGDLQRFERRALNDERLNGSENG